MDPSSGQQEQSHTPPSFPAEPLSPSFAPPVVRPKGLFFVASDLDDEPDSSVDPTPLLRDGGDLEDCGDAQHHDECARQNEFLDLDELQFLSVEGIDKQKRKILRIVGKFFPAPVVGSSRLKDYVVQKVTKDIGEERFCVVYFHSLVKRNENCPGVLTLRWIYETIPQEYRQRLEVVYFVHPGLLSRTILGTIGRFFLSDGLYGKLKYVNRIEFLWDHLKKGQIEIPDFVHEHDAELEYRPLMDYGVEADPLYMTYGMSNIDSAYIRQSVRWAP